MTQFLHQYHNFDELRIKKTVKSLTYSFFHQLCYNNFCKNWRIIKDGTKNYVQTGDCR